MQRDEFGNLTEWGSVLERLEELKRVGDLDGHQMGLARLMRFRGNPKLREAALECCREISEASDLLIAEALNTLADEDTPLRLRVLAADSLGHLLPRYAPAAASPFDIDRALETMVQVAARVQPPILAEAVERALAAAGASGEGAAAPAGERGSALAMAGAAGAR